MRVCELCQKPAISTQVFTVRRQEELDVKATTFWLDFCSDHSYFADGKDGYAELIVDSLKRLNRQGFDVVPKS